MKVKEILAENYVKVATNVSGRKVVNVYRAICMRELPEHLVKVYADPERHCHDCPVRGIKYSTENPDYGEYDAQVILVHHGYVVDLYVCAILVRPFSQEAFHYYGSIMGMLSNRRARLMWDSRVFDGDIAEVEPRPAEKVVKKKRVRATLGQVRELERAASSLEQENDKLKSDVVKLESKNLELSNKVKKLSEKLEELEGKYNLQLIADSELAKSVAELKGHNDWYEKRIAKIEGRSFLERVFNMDLT